jgi:hypothetical protein
MAAVKEMQRIEYAGPERLTGLVIKTLNEAGLDVTTEPPPTAYFNLMSMAQPVADGVVVYFVCKGTEAAVGKAVKRVRERLGRRGRIRRVNNDDQVDDSEYRPRHGR